MNQKTATPADLHADHRQWQSDISMWQFDIKEWRSEHATALEELAKITELIELHETTLNEHADSVGTIETAMEFHEKTLAASIHDHADSDLDDALLGGHAKEAEKIAKQREAHERIKKHHHIAMAHVASLKRALESAM